MAVLFDNNKWIIIVCKLWFFCEIIGLIYLCIAETKRFYPV